MDSLEVSRRIQAIEALITKTEAYAEGDIERQSHWAKYLCVLAAGCLEQSLIYIYVDYCKSTASGKVANYTAAKLKTIRNPKTRVFLDVTSSFDKMWGVKLEDFLDDEGRGEAINSIMTNRHRIAHGNTSHITVARVKEYFRTSVAVLEFLEQLCKGRHIDADE
jgi:hypothetical protein